MSAIRLVLTPSHYCSVKSYTPTLLCVHGMQKMLTHACMVNINFKKSKQAVYMEWFFFFAKSTFNFKWRETKYSPKKATHAHI